MKKIKVVYEWISPRGPLANNTNADLYHLASGLHGVQVDATKGGGAYLWTQVFQYHRDMFELSSPFGIQDGDFFIYDYQLHHKWPYMDFFAKGAATGLLECIQMSHNVLHNIRFLNGYLFMDMALEAWVSPTTFRAMHRYFDNWSIPTNKVIYQTGASNAADLYDKFCRENNIPDNLRMKVFSWDSQEWIWSVRYANEDYDNRKHIDLIEKTFMCLNYRYRPHRLDATMLFHKLDLLKDSFFTLPARNPEVWHDEFRTNINPAFKEKIGITDEELRALEQKLPLRIDSLPESHVNHFRMTHDDQRELKEFYTRSLVAIITETLAYDEAVTETEKTLKAIAHKQPFILVAAPKALHYLRSHGYQTFSRWWDESYDNIEDHYDRMVAIGNVCKDIHSWDRNKRAHFLEETKGVLQHNYDKMKSTRLSRLPEMWYTLLNLAQQTGEK